MYEDIQGFEKKDFMEGEWRSYIEFVQYAAPFYITYHCFPEIFHAIEALAKLFIKAEADDVTGLVDEIVERVTSDPPQCPFIPQIEVAIRTAIQAKGGIFQVRHTPRRQSPSQARSNARALPEMLNLMDEPVPDIPIQSLRKCGSGRIGTLYTCSNSTKRNQSLPEGTQSHSFPPKSNKIPWQLG
ncbi:hypothetical protein MMC15_002183 [Xylographa vitiligo]|nr:hypothetical protein [Xylographa vitiligo]